MIKELIPIRLKFFIKKMVYGLKLCSNYFSDLKRYLEFSGLVNYRNDGKKLIASIIRNYHVIEKGLTMPDMRAGFGQPRIKHLLNDCIFYIETYGDSNTQLTHSIKVINEYLEIHSFLNFQLDPELKILYERLKDRLKRDLSSNKQLEASKESYFKHNKSDFKEFSESRHSLRNYCSDAVPYQDLVDAISLAQNSPSACNRQASRVYLITEKQEIDSILNLQGGNRGFGHLADKLIIITADVSVYCNFGERNQAFVDGGIHALNILYSLHYYSIGACILNCSHDLLKDRQMRKLCNIPESEVFIAMISCGIPPKEFKIASSKRFPIEEILTIKG